MKWYKTWWMSEVVDTDHIKDITCTDVDGREEHLMKDVNLEDMFCVDSEQVAEEISTSQATPTTLRHRHQSKHQWLW